MYILLILQLSWATTNYVGCGAYRCPQTTGFPYPNSLNLVCNYGPGYVYIVHGIMIASNIII